MNKRVIHSKNALKNKSVIRIHEDSETTVAQWRCCENLFLHFHSCYTNRNQEAVFPGETTVGIQIDGECYLGQVQVLRGFLCVVDRKWRLVRFFCYLALARKRYGSHRGRIQESARLSCRGLERRGNFAIERPYGKTLRGAF